MTTPKIVKRGEKSFASLNELPIPEWYGKKPIAGKQNFLKHSLREKGFLKPIVINVSPGRSGVILDGVHTVYACKELGISEVPIHQLYVQPEHEGECHVLLNKFQTENDEKQERKLMKERYYQFFEADSDILDNALTKYDVASSGSVILASQDEEISEYADIIKFGEEVKRLADQKPLLTIRRCVFNLPPELRDLPEMAMKALGYGSLSQLYIYLLKCCLEDSQNEAA